MCGRAIPYASVVATALLVVGSIMFLGAYEAWLDIYKDIFSTDIPEQLRPVAVFYLLFIVAGAISVILIGIFATGGVRAFCCRGETGAARGVRVGYRCFMIVVTVYVYVIAVAALAVLCVAGALIGVQVIIWLAGELALKGTRAISSQNVAVSINSLNQRCPPRPGMQCLNLEPFA